MSDAPPKPSIGMMIANLAATLPSTLTSAVLEQVRLSGVEQGKAEYRAKFLIEQHEHAVKQAVEKATEELRETVAALSSEGERLRGEVARLRKQTVIPSSVGEIKSAKQSDADQMHEMAKDPIATYGALRPLVNGLKPHHVASWSGAERMDALRWAADQAEWSQPPCIGRSLNTEAG